MPSAPDAGETHDRFGHRAMQRVDVGELVELGLAKLDHPAAELPAPRRQPP